MSDQGEEMMATSVQERVGKAEQEIHTLNFRVNTLEKLPHRVTEAEKNIESLAFNMAHLQERQQEIRDDMAHGFDAVHEKVDGISTKIDAGFKELRDAVSSQVGEKKGFSYATKIYLAVLTVSAAAIGTVLWYWDHKDAPGPDVAGMSAECRDGTYSTSGGRGVCSNHDGVKRWIY